MFNATSSIKNIPWSKAPKSESRLRAFARRHNFSPRRRDSGKWVICWSSYGDPGEYDTAIEAIRAEVEYHQKHNPHPRNPHPICTP